MFDFFNNSPEKKLITRLKKAFDDEAKFALKESPNEVLSGMFINLALQNLYNGFIRNSYEISRQYDVPLDKVTEILKKCVNETLSNYIDNAEEYFV